MLLLTGDCHGDFHRFSTRLFPQQRSMDRERDFVIVTGDFGGVWDGSRNERYWLRFLEEKPFTLLFVGGNHENYDELDNICPELWHGGLVHRVRPNILHLLNGYVFSLDGYSIFVMGGASTHDAPGGILKRGDDFKARKKQLDRRKMRYRVEHETWWAHELPTNAEYLRAEEVLRSRENSVDLVLTHCAPTSIHRSLDPELPSDHLTDWLEELMHRLDYKHWYCGHYHRQTSFPESRLDVLYEDIIKI